MATIVNLVGEPADRLDTWLAGRTELGLSRSQVQRLIDDGLVRVAGQTAHRGGLRLRGGEAVEVDVPEPEPALAEPEAIPLDIVHEDADVIVINKARGLVVHPAAGNPRGTLVNALLHHCDLPGIGGAIRPGIVHRLDKDTTGLLVVAKTEAALASLQRQIAQRQVKRQYLALVHGVPPEAFDVDAPIGRDPRNRKRMAVIGAGESARSRRAVSHVRRVRAFARHGLLEVTLETGRTHQIRVHLAHAGYPVVGDPVYGRPALDRQQGIALDGQALHAARIAFEHPATGQAMAFSAPLPGDFVRVLEELGRS
jgi:23S rRNA pseudouridine1911/1915/1917 synthase